MILWGLFALSVASNPPNILILVLDDFDYTQSMEDEFQDPSIIPHGAEVKEHDIPNIMDFMKESVVFSRNYAGGTMCAPSRYTMLTGRYPVQSAWARTKTAENSGFEKAGTTVNVPYVKLVGEESMVSVLHGEYRTGMVGKWHLMPENWVDTKSYSQQTDALKLQGFDFVDAFYFGNVGRNDDFGHNPEWKVCILCI